MRNSIERFATNRPYEFAGLATIVVTTILMGVGKCIIDVVKSRKEKSK